MPENLMTKDHKATNDNYRKNYDKVFDVKSPTEIKEEAIERQLHRYELERTDIQ